MPTRLSSFQTLASGSQLYLLKYNSEQRRLSRNFFFHVSAAARGYGFFVEFGRVAAEALWPREQARRAVQRPARRFKLRAGQSRRASARGGQKARLSRRGKRSSRAEWWPQGAQRKVMARKVLRQLRTGCRRVGTRASRRPRGPPSRNGRNGRWSLAASAAAQACRRACRGARRRCPRDLGRGEAREVAEGAPLDRQATEHAATAARRPHRRHV